MEERARHEHDVARARCRSAPSRGRSARDSRRRSASGGPCCRPTRSPGRAARCGRAAVRRRARRRPRSPRAGRRDPRSVPSRDAEHEARIRELDQRVALGRGQPRRERLRHGAELPGRPRGLEERERVRQRDADEVARADAARGEGAREAVASPVELRARDGCAPRTRSRRRRGRPRRGARRRRGRRGWARGLRRDRGAG